MIVNKFGANFNLQNIFKTNSNLLNASVKQIESFTKNELPNIEQSSKNALSQLEQSANNIKALLNIKK